MFSCLFSNIHSKISRYTPSDNTKVFDKAVQRITVPNFNPKATIEIVNKERSADVELTEQERRQLLQQYLDVSLIKRRQSDVYDQHSYPMLITITFVCSIQYTVQAANAQDWRRRIWRRFWSGS